jgi:hypothetical protein
MATDFRTDPMESPEGRGIARTKAWQQYRAFVDRNVTPVIAPFVKPAVAPVARQMVEDMIGFWVMWHLYGGFEGLEGFGMHKSTIWRKVSRFRQMTGEHPDEFKMPGVEIDAAKYWAASGTEARSSHS